MIVKCPTCSYEWGTKNEVFAQRQYDKMQAALRANQSARVNALEVERDALVAAGKIVLADLDARIHEASERGSPVPVFNGIADLHDALALAEGESPEGN